MKKILSMFVALLLLVSVPASAAPKTNNHTDTKKKVYIEKKVDIKLKAVLINLNGNPSWDLTAEVPKRGSSFNFEWTILLDGKDTGIKLPASNPKYSYKSGIYTVKAKFTPADLSKKYEVTFKAVMNAGKSPVIFVGKETAKLDKIIPAPPQPKTPTYEFKVEGIPSIIRPNQAFTFPLTLRAAKADNTPADLVKINVTVSKPTKMLLTSNNINLITSQQLGDAFVIDKNYEKKTDITASFTEAGAYTATFTLVRIYPYKELATKTINFTVYPDQSSTIQRIDILKLKLSPIDAAKAQYNLIVDKLLVVYYNGHSVTVTNFNYASAAVNLNQLTDPNYSIKFNIVYNNTAYPYTMTSKQILELLIKE